MRPLLNNTRYILELEREVLLKKNVEFEERYGTLSLAFLTSLETLALLAYFYIAAVLVYYKATRTKTNFLVSAWAVLNSIVVLEKICRTVGVFPATSEDLAHLAEMIGGLARIYGSYLLVVWLFCKYFVSPKPKYDFIMYLLVLFPFLTFVYSMYHYFSFNKFVYEAYAPSCDVVSATIYILVALVVAMCTIFARNCQNASSYTLLISLANLITNLPLCLITIYIRFNLDINWSYRFHYYFVDTLVNAISCSGAFAVLLIITFYNENVRSLFTKRKVVDSELDSQMVGLAVKM